MDRRRFNDWVVGIALLVFATTSAIVHAENRIGHVPLVVQDLQRAGSDFERLGFTVKPGRPHANGLDNLHLKFPDGTEIELMTARRSDDAQSAAYRKMQLQGDGPAYLALYVPSPVDLSRRLRDRGWAGRLDRRTLTMADGNALSYLFFSPVGDGIDLNRSPTDRPAYYRHANTADALIAVWIAADDLSPEHSLLGALGVVWKRQAVRVPEDVDAEVAVLDRGRLVMLPGKYQRYPGRRIVGVTLHVQDIDATRRILATAGYTGLRRIDGPTGTTLVLPPSAAHGMWIAFQSGALAQAKRIVPTR